MHWEHEDIIKSVMSSFAACELPDAHGQQDDACEITPAGSLRGAGQYWRVEADIPTSAMDAWFTFTLVLAEDTIKPVVRDVRCIRNGHDDGAEYCE